MLTHTVPGLYFVTCLAAFVILKAIQHIFLPPANLRHIPHVPILPLLLSYLTGEIDERRIKRLIIPFAYKKQAGIVLVWFLGQWSVHIMDAKTGRLIFENRNIRKQKPPPEMMFWRFTGRQNVFFAEGEEYQKHARIFRSALQRTIPMEQLAALSRKLFAHIGIGRRVRWDDYTRRLTLDVVGTTVLGYDFEALDKPDGPFVKEYHDIISAISSRPYIFLPALERWFPRNSVRRRLDAFVERFHGVLEAKKTNPGNDVITYMFEEPNMTVEEHRSNVVVLFMGGHDTTSGALSTLIFCLGLYPAVQARARVEVLSIVKPGEDLTMEHLSRMRYLRAVIWEAMRYNNSSNFTVARVSDIPIQVNGLIIPPETPIFLNMCAVLHNERYWEKPSSFNPERFMDGDTRADEGNWTPFGLGPRQCPARKFSLTEQRFLTAMLLREYEWTIPTDSIHINGIRNAFSPFAINAPFDMDIDFRKL